MLSLLLEECREAGIASSYTMLIPRPLRVIQSTYVIQLPAEPKYSRIQNKSRP